MRKKVSILFIMLSTFMVLVSSVMPHHHHEGMICIGVETCYAEQHNCGCESEHHSGNDANHEHHSCTADAQYLTKQSVDDAKQKNCSCNNLEHIHLFPVHFIVNWLLSPIETVVEKTEYGEFLITYTSVNVNHAHGLRAPPYFA